MFTTGPQNYGLLIAESPIQLHQGPILEITPQIEEIFFGVLPVMTLEPLEDLRLTHPAPEIHLIASHMKDIAVEQFGHVFVDIAQDRVDVIIDGVQLAARWRRAVVIPQNQMSQAVLVTPLPSVASVGRSIQLRDDFDPAYGGVVNDVMDVLRTVDLAARVGPVDGHQWLPLAHHRERLRVG